MKRWTPWAVRATTPAQRGEVHAFERATGYRLSVGYSGAWHIAVRDGYRLVAERRVAGDLPTLLRQVMDGVRERL